MSNKNSIAKYLLHERQLYARKDIRFHDVRHPYAKAKIKELNNIHRIRKDLTIMIQTSNLQSLINRYYDDLVFSLNASGLDIDTDDWPLVTIDRNAYKSAGILISVAVHHLKCWDVFLQAIITGCRRESMLMETMDLICATFEHVGVLPPLGIIQHTLDPDLLKIYCMDLADWLEKYMQNAPDTVLLHPASVLE